MIEVARSGDHFEKMKALLKTGANSDITLVVKTEEFKVHKFPLATHSAVFEAMFQHENTKETIEKKVVIEDVSAEVMRTLLHYIYTGTVENKDDLSVELFSAADKVGPFSFGFHNYYLYLIFILTISSTRWTPSKWPVSVSSR